MTTITKKQINEFVGAKEDWSIFGWEMWRADMCYVDGKWNMFKAFKGQGLAESIYNGTYNLNIEVTEEISAWLSRYETKTRIVDIIFDKVKTAIDDHLQNWVE